MQESVLLVLQSHCYPTLSEGVRGIAASGLRSTESSCEGTRAASPPARDTAIGIGIDSAAHASAHARSTSYTEEVHIVMGGIR